MKFSSRTLAFVACLGLGAGLLLPSVGRSQEPRLRLPRRPSDAGKMPAVVGAPTDSPVANIKPMPTLAVVTDMDRLNKRIADLEAKVASQQRQLDNVTKFASDAPKGYSRAFITLGSISSLSPKDGISYWAHNAR